MTQPLFETQRTRVISAYQKAGIPFLANTKPYRSTAVVLFNVSPAFGAAASETVAFAVADPQSITWFDKQIGGDIASDGGAFTRKATASDTNMVSASETNAEDFIIEGFTAGVHAVKCIVPSATATNVPVGALPANILALYDQGLLRDPSSSTLPPQVDSPFNLQDPWADALFPHIALDLKFGDNRVEKLGNLEDMPGGSGKSYLKANGSPDRSNRYAIPEGYLWRKRGGETDSKLIIAGRLTRPVGFLLNLVGQPGRATVFPRQRPTMIAVEIQMRLHGVALKTPSQN